MLSCDTYACFLILLVRSLAIKLAFLSRDMEMSRWQEPLSRYHTCQIYAVNIMAN